MQPPLPIVRLTPKADARAIRWGAPWIYAGDLVADRRTRALPGGTLAVLQDHNRVDMGLVAVNPASKIIARMIDTDPQAIIDENWFAEKFTRALAHRERLFETPYYRLIHAEADGLPGVIIDRFGDLAVLQPNAAWAEHLLEVMVKALGSATGIKTVIKNGNSRGRALEGLSQETEVLQGLAPKAALQVPINGATYLADVLAGQKTGLYYDQRPNQAFAAGLAKGGSVLDVFSHVGGFALAALAAGAERALAIDGSAPALELAEQGAAAMGMGARFSTSKSDAFAALSSLAEEKARFDLVVCDPPAFAPHKQALQTGLRAYEKLARQAATLVAPGGYLVLCSCSHAAEISKFRAACIRGIGRAGRRAQLIHTGSAGPDHPQLPALAESGYLKALFFRL